MDIVALPSPPLLETPQETHMSNSTNPIEEVSAICGSTRIPAKNKRTPAGNGEINQGNLGRRFHPSEEVDKYSGRSVSHTRTECQPTTEEPHR
jgi:hypothetical protein